MKGFRHFFGFTNFDENIRLPLPDRDFLPENNNDATMEEYKWTGRLNISYHIFTHLDCFFIFIRVELLDIMVEDGKKY